MKVALLCNWLIRACSLSDGHVYRAALPADVLRQLERVGSEWTIAEWMRKQTGLDMPGEIRVSIAREVFVEKPRRGTISTDRSAVLQACADLGVMPDYCDGYLACLYIEYERQLANRHDFPLTYLEFCVCWLGHEHRLMTQLAPLCFGLPGNRRAIRRALLRGFIESHATASDSIEQGEMIVSRPGLLDEFVSGRCRSGLKIHTQGAQLSKPAGLWEVLDAQYSEQG